MQQQRGGAQIGAPTPGSWRAKTMVDRGVRTRAELALVQARSALRWLLSDLLMTLEEPHALHAFCRMWSEAWTLARAGTVASTDAAATDGRRGASDHEAGA